MLAALPCGGPRRSRNATEGVRDRIWNATEGVPYRATQSACGVRLASKMCLDWVRPVAKVNCAAANVVADSLGPGRPLLPSKENVVGKAYPTTQPSDQSVRRRWSKKTGRWRPICGGSSG